MRVVGNDARRKLDECAKLISQKQVLWSEGRDGGVLYQSCYGDVAEHQKKQTGSN